MRYEQKGDAYESRIEVSVKLEELLTDLATKRRITPSHTEGATEQGSDEYEQILNLLVQAPEGVSQSGDHC